MSHFLDETIIEQTGAGTFSASLTKAWDIGDNANGGYVVTPVLRAMASMIDLPDPISVTSHYLRPTNGSLATDVSVEVVRSGRSVATLRAELSQEGVTKMVTMAAFGDVSTTDDGPAWQVAVPEMPAPEDCVDRRGLEQGVDLPILSRVDVMVHPDHAVAGESKLAVMDGWIRFCDGTSPSAMSLPLFADAFPPSVFSRLGFVGWVPTIELTVHVRRQPADGWIRARFETDDLAGQRFIESGTLWDSTGQVVARSRQLGMVLSS